MKQFTICIFNLLISIFTSTAQILYNEDLYENAYDEISKMLIDKCNPSIKRATFLAEWAYLDGKINYHDDFCKEIDRIKNFVLLFYETNNLQNYKTGKLIALNEYFFNPYSGNQYSPYIYDFENFSMDNENWETQFVSKVLKTHKGQCRSLPWLYKILSLEVGAEAFIAKAPRHSYIMYRDADKLTPENWINLELTSQQMVPTFWIKENNDILDSAIVVGTYMTPLTDIETIADQLSDLAFGYYKKFNRYDYFTLKCTEISLRFHPMNPNALLIRGKSLEWIIREEFERNKHIITPKIDTLLNKLKNNKIQLTNTYMTYENEEIREKRRKQMIESEQNQKRRLRNSNH